MIRPVLAGRGQVGRVVATGGAAAVLLIHDDFNAANGTAISGRTPSPVNLPGNTWAILGTATWTIQSNRASKTAGGANNLAVINAADADVTITCDVTIANAGGERHGVGLRASDVNNFWALTWRNTNLVEIIERNGGTVTVRASAALTLTPGNTYEFKLVAIGTSLTGYVDGVQYVSYGSATLNQTNTNHGIYAGATAQPTWDNFKVLSQ